MGIASGCFEIRGLASLSEAHESEQVPEWTEAQVQVVLAEPTSTKGDDQSQRTAIPGRVVPCTSGEAKQ
jgi:hypothetical protein